jgi:hypothetical protein
MAIVTDAVLKTYFETNDIPTEAQYASLVDSKVNVLDEPKVYIATLTQSGTGAPSATVIKNTLGASVVWTRSSTGLYIGTATGLFTVDKTFFNGNANNGNTGYLSLAVISVNSVSISAYSVAGDTPADSIILSKQFKIEVYP